MKPHDEARLERLIHQTLRDLPERRAPQTLEQRVLGEIARRATQPWWRQNFAHWPAGARLIFIGVSLAAIAFLMWVAGGLNAAQARELFATPLAWIDTVRVVGHAVGDFASATFRSIPPLWLYGGLAIVGTLYVTLFGLGAAAYRAFYAPR
jgi:hypothetical protein